MPPLSARAISALLLALMLTSCGELGAAKLAADLPRVPRPAPIRVLVQRAALHFMRQFQHRQYAAQWAALAPQARSIWPDQRARTAMLRVKFAGIPVRRVTVGRPVAGVSWQGAERLRSRAAGTWQVPVSIAFTGNPRPTGVTATYRHLSLNLVVDGKKVTVVGEGPASLDAPVIVPRHSIQQQVHVPILMYHRVAPLPRQSQWTNSYGYTIEYGLTVPPAQFSAEMAYLARAHFHSISLTRLADSLLYGLPLPPHSVVLTFDDGRASPYHYAVPVLRRYGFTAVFFPCSALVGQTVQTPNHLNVQHYLSWPQIHRLAQMGFWIEDHGQKDQQVLWALTMPQLKAEAGASAQALAARSGRPVQFIAYTGALWPYPSAASVGPPQQSMFARLGTLGYVGGVTDTRVPSSYESSDEVWHLPRVRIQPNETLAGFIASLSDG